MNRIESIPQPAKAGDLVIPPDERKTLRTLEQNECRWPYGNPRRKDFYYCGKLSVAGRPYCAFHMRQAFQSMRACV
jgi:GcrA cell cycle regulator